MRRKLGGRFRSVNSIATLLLALCVTGCLRQPRTITQIDAMTWSGVLRDAQRTPYLAEPVADNPAEQWEERFGRGFTDVPAIQGDLVISTSTAKTISVASAESGRPYWERRTNGAIVGSLIRLDGRIYAATQSRDGRVEAFTLSRGRHLWTYEMQAPTAGGAVLVDSVLYVGSQDAELFALHTEGLQELWMAKLPAAPVAAPVAWGTSLYVATVGDSLLPVDRASGTVRPGVRLAGSVAAPIALQGDRLILALHPGMVQAVRLPSLAVEWTADLGAPVLAAPALDADGSVFALTRPGDVWHITADGVAHRIAELGGVATASLTLTADGLLVGLLDGTLVLLRRDGTEVWRRQFERSIRTPVAVRDGAIYVPLSDGHLVMLR